MAKPSKVKLSTADKVYYSIVYSVIIFLTILVLYPLIFVVSSSFSSGQAVTSGRVVLWPVEFSVESYKRVYEYKVIWTGYRADVLVVDGNPADDITVLQRRDRLRAVVSRGEQVDLTMPWPTRGRIPGEKVNNWADELLTYERATAVSTTSPGASTAGNGNGDDDR